MLLFLFSTKAARALLTAVLQLEEQAASQWALLQDGAAGNEGAQQAAAWAQALADTQAQHAKQMDALLAEHESQVSLLNLRHTSTTTGRERPMHTRKLQRPLAFQWCSSVLCALLERFEAGHVACACSWRRCVPSLSHSWRLLSCGI